MALPETTPLSERARLYGCPELVQLDERLARPQQLDYLDLLPRQTSGPLTLNVRGRISANG